MGSSGVDIQLSHLAKQSFPFSVECKNHERMAIYKMFEQAQANAGELSPLLAVKSNRKPVLAVLLWSDFEELLKKNKDE